MKTIATLSILLWVFLVSSGIPTAQSQTIVLIPKVPDANQPPTVILPTTIPNNFCAPISVANILVYWDTVVKEPRAIGVTVGLGTQTVAEYVGWFMDTNNTGSPQRGNGPHPGTYTKDEAPGIFEFARWDSAHPFATPPPDLPPCKVGSTWNLSVDDIKGFPFYKAEIDAGRPAVVNFLYWNPIPAKDANGNPIVVKDIQVYDFGPPIFNSGEAEFPPDDFFEQWNREEGGMGIGHAVTGVGYIPNWDPDGPGPLPLDNYAIVNDNWPNTPHDPAAKYMTIPWQNWNATVSVEAPPHQVRKIYVDAINGDDINGDGTAGNPYATIQKGIDEAFSGDTVLVANGTYTGPGNKDLDFKCKAIIVQSINGASNCIIDCQGAGRGFYFHCGETQQSVVSGFSIINGDSAFGGGGIACENSSPTIENNIISDNKASSGNGGGIACTNNSSPMIINNTITRNWAEDIGGGIACTNNSSPTIINNIIAENEALDGGGGIACYSSSPTIQNNMIYKNSAGPLGAPGGGIACTNNSSPKICNNTISGNKSTWQGGGIYCANSSPMVLNTILWDDTPNEIYVVGTPAVINITYSDIQGGYLGVMNIDVNPDFVNPATGDYHLNNSSPCIGGGHMASCVPTKDFEGNPRPDPANSNPDIGADENPNDSAGTITLNTPGPTTWSYILTWNRGAVIQWSYTGAGITSANVTGQAATARWTVASQTTTQVVFLATLKPLTSGSLDGFEISGPQPGIGSWICHANSGNVDGPLPVELSIFTASADSMKVTLYWRTESETNNLGFNVYRSDTKDSKYIKINARPIAGAGSDATPHDYSFADENVLFGKTYYYYIEDVDFDGKKGKSPILQITIGKDSEVKVIDKSNIIVPSKLQPIVIPTEFALLQNFPNPFNPETWIPFKLAQDASVVIHIYSAKGQLVRTITLSNQEAGAYLTKDKAAYWDGRDGAGELVASGVYFYTLQAGDFQATRRMAIVK